MMTLHFLQELFFEKNEWFLLVPKRGGKAWPNALSLRDEYMTLKNLSLFKKKKS